MPTSESDRRRKGYERYVHPQSSRRTDESKHTTVGRTFHRSRRRYRNRGDESEKIFRGARPFSHYDGEDNFNSLQQLQQRNRRALFLAALVLSAYTWITLFQQPPRMIHAPINSTNKITQVHNPFVSLSHNSASTRNKRVPSSKFTKSHHNSSSKQSGEDIRAILAEEHVTPKRWNPCPKKFELERHDHEPRHGDICRIKGGIMSYFECPDGCHETSGNPPYCAQDTKLLGKKSKPCRARNPNAKPEYRCDDIGVCILAVGSPKEQFKGSGVYYDDSCDERCGDRSKYEKYERVRCTSDLDCSLAGICLPETKACLCDPWADGPDCSYLKFQPVDISRLGYMNEHHSSWGGSVVYSSKDGMYHMYVSEILCKANPDSRKRCGLSAWETHSRVTVAKSANVAGPYTRNGTDKEIVLRPEHHNPSIHVSPTGEWHLFTISGSSGPIERMISDDEGKTWSEPTIISPRQNPGPLLKPDGSTYLYYRADGMDLPSPTCSDEGIAMQICPVAESCHPPNDTPLFGHTGEDPSVFIDHRGNYHMLFNALPYKCVPKFQQGGHAWSKDGIHWNTSPRVGAFGTTIQFTDGTSIKCERRERPQMILGVDGKPVALVTGLTGCPRGLLNRTDIDVGNNGNANFYRGGDDSFTLVQLMAR